MILIGIGHKKFRGKDAFAARLVDKHRFIRISWADKVKQSAKLIGKFTDEQLYGKLKETIDPRWGMTPREFLQKFGSDACRDNVHKDIWIISAWLEIQEVLKQNSDANFVIPDVRFPNEASFIKEKSGILIRIDRNGIDDSSFGNHQSETALDDYDQWDFVVDNNSSLKSLYHKADIIFNEIKEGREEVKNKYGKR